MLLGIFGMDSSVAQIYKLFDKLEDNLEQKQRIHEELVKVVRKYGTTLFSDFENYFKNLKNEINNLDIPEKLKTKFLSSTVALVKEYKAENSKLNSLIEKYKSEDYQSLQSAQTKKSLKKEIEKFIVGFLCDKSKQFESLTKKEMDIFYSIVQDFNTKTNVSQIPKIIDRTPNFDLQNVEDIDKLLKVYHKSYLEFDKFDMSTIEWDLSFEHALRSGGKLDFSEAKISYDYLKSKGKKIRALSMVYPSACPNFSEDITKEEFTTLFSNYLHMLFRTCPDIDYLDFFNELVYDEGMHAMMGDAKRPPNEKGVVLETGQKGQNPSVFERLFGSRYYIDLLVIARKVMAEEEQIQGRKITTKLMYNEFGHENAEKSKSILKILKDIVDYEQQNNIQLLDGIGVQCRLRSDIPLEGKNSLRTIQNFIETARGIDPTFPLEIQITECDVIQVNENADSKVLPEQRQETVYHTIFDMAMSLMDKGILSGFTLGDFNDTTSFSSQQEFAKSISKNPSPTLYDEKGKIKPFAEPLLADLKKNIEYNNEQAKYANKTPTENW